MTDLPDVHLDVSAPAAVTLAQLQVDEIPMATAVWDALDDALPGEAGDANLELPDEDVGKSAGLELDVPELAFLAWDAAAHQHLHLRSAVWAWPAPDIQDEAQSAAQSYAARLAVALLELLDEQSELSQLVELLVAYSPQQAALQ